MNAETAFAKTLGDDEQEKLAAHFDAYSADELADLLMEKAAGPQFHDLTNVFGRAKAQAQVGASKAKGWVKRNPKTAIGAGLGTVTGVGTALAMRKKPEEKTIQSSAEIADIWGRELAHEDVEKTATGLGSPLGTGSMAPSVPKLKPPGAATMGVAKPGSVGGAPKIASVTKEAFLGAMAAKAAPMLAKAMPAVQRVAQSTVGQAAGGGAIVGGGVNAVRHLMKPKDPQTGQRQGSMLGAVAKGAVGGAVGGLGARALAQKFGPGMQVAAWKQGPKMLPPAASAAPQLPPGPAQRGGPPRGGPASGQVIDVPFKTVNASARLSSGSVNNPFR